MRNQTLFKRQHNSHELQEVTNLFTETPQLRPHTSFDCNLDVSDKLSISIRKQMTLFIPATEALDNILDDLLSQGFIRKSQSKTVSPLLMVKQPNKCLICFDYQI
jgi:hypothetical protein